MPLQFSHALHLFSKLRIQFTTHKYLGCLLLLLHLLNIIKEFHHISLYINLCNPNRYL